MCDFGTRFLRLDAVEYHGLRPCVPPTRVAADASQTRSRRQPHCRAAQWCPAPLTLALQSLWLCRGVVILQHLSDEESTEWGRTEALVPLPRTVEDRGLMFNCAAAAADVA